MDPVTLALILGGAGLGMMQGQQKARQSRRQYEQDELRNAIEAKYSWILNPAYRDPTTPLSEAGAMMGGALAGGMQGAWLGNLGGGGGGEGSVLMDPSAKAASLSTAPGGAFGVQPSLVPQKSSYTLGAGGLPPELTNAGAWGMNASAPSISPGTKVHELGAGLVDPSSPWAYGGLSLAVPTTFRDNRVPPIETYRYDPYADRWGLRYAERGL